MIVSGFKVQLSCLIELVSYCKYSIKVMPLTESNKSYLRNLIKSVVNLQRCVRQIDETYNLLHLQPKSKYLEGLKALRYDPFDDFRMAISRYNDLVNDTFLFVE